MDDASALFFLGSHNEVDQISPVIYKLADRGNLSIDVLLQTGVPRDDYRIDFLDSYDTLNIHSRRSSGSTLSNTVGAFIDGAKTAGRKMPTQIPERVYQLYKHQGGGGAGRDLTVPSELSGTSWDVVGFDWGHAESDDTFVARDDVRTIVLPHGDSPYVNHQTESQSYFNSFLDDLRESDDVLAWSEIPQQNNYHTYLDHDYLLFPNERTASRVSSEDGTDRIRTLGSPRYNPEWLEVLSDIRPQVDAPSSGALKVVIFVRQDCYFVTKTELEHTIELLEAFPGVRTIVKEHPRAPLLEPSIVDEMETVSIANDEVESASLVQWGDVFLDMGTTISFEPIVRDKPVLELDYTHANYTVISESFSNVDMRCKDDLFYAIRTFRTEGTDTFYSRPERQTFENEIVTSGNDAVLESYAVLFEEAAGVSVDS